MVCKPQIKAFCFGLFSLQGRTKCLQHHTVETMSPLLKAFGFYFENGRHLLIQFSYGCLMQLWQTTYFPPYILKNSFELLNIHTLLYSSCEVEYSYFDQQTK